jgi:hypothetical protein
MSMEATIPSVPADPPRYGVIPLLNRPEVPAELAARFAMGWSFLAEGCDSSGTEPIVCGSTAELDDIPQAGPIIGQPVFLWAEDTCSAFGFRSRDWEGRVTRALAAHQSYDLAAELWDGAAALAGGLDNPWYTQADIDVSAGTPLAVGKALGCLEEALGLNLKGSPGLVHFTPQALTQLVQLGAVWRDGAVWRSPMGNLVVADAGYSGNGPGGDVAGETQWAYATPMIQVYLSPVQVIPGSTEQREAMAQAMDISTNDVTVRAGRLAAAVWANECVLAAAELDLPICGLGS